MSKERIVEVDWIDSCSHTGWHSRREAERKTVTHCFTVGYLISSTRQHLAIAQSKDEPDGEHEDLSNVWTIPRVCVKSIRTLRVVE